LNYDKYDRYSCVHQAFLTGFAVEACTVIDSQSPCNSRILPFCAPRSGHWCRLYHLHHLLARSSPEVGFRFPILDPLISSRFPQDILQKLVVDPFTPAPRQHLSLFAVVLVWLSVICKEWSLIRYTGLKAKAQAKAEAAAEKVIYQVSLKQQKAGESDEHWSLHYHPKEAKKGDLHILEAVSDDDPKHNGVLQISHTPMGQYNPQSASTTTRHIADFPSKEAAMVAMNDVLQNVKLTQKFPYENCVDWTCQAVQHMAGKGRVPQASANAFEDYYNKHKDVVRATTNTAEHRKNAGA
jgi:hypothetical protein